MPSTREKFATQVDAQTLASFRHLAEEEGRQIQALVEEAFIDLIEKHKHARPRAQVLNAYAGSLERFDSLYKKLAE